ncbi:phytoene/squalene synthase family protein [Mesorhizobium sp. RP14(2022)]|uniref:Phytoene/squalene synthase family protein n=1 Tax=Mesorhizobium liriopis TaxID=2953882 RepID=A0ABT1C526_9HYPH|nr:phytoene/squalene synthase family protein [Mesorhizobium liriopis]MCO6049938.1 phytoene/squalene synthase family protein [Mesorhizobium liriopis]
MSDALQAYADASIAKGSQSFAAASRLFDEETRRDVAKLYAWCRHCDDVVDGQELGHGRIEQAASPLERLAGLELQTHAALGENRAVHPAFQCLADVTKRHGIAVARAFDHLAGFRMDVEDRRFRTLDELLLYCYGVAGVVGVMMAQVMGARDPATLDRACDLGLAFQLTNIARDIVDDAQLGRIYLPLDWLDEAGIPIDAVADPINRTKLASLAKRLVEAAEPYYDSAARGIADLPLRAAWAIAAARGIYRAIGRKVVARGPSAWDSRVSTSRSEKLGVLSSGGLLALRSRMAGSELRSPALWRRPV